MAETEADTKEKGDAAADDSATATKPDTKAKSAKQPESFALEGSCCLGCSRYGGTLDSCEYLRRYAMQAPIDSVRVLQACGNIVPLKGE